MALLQVYLENGEQRRIEVNGQKQSLHITLCEAGIFLDAPCGGKSTCGRCRVRFLEHPPVPTKREMQVLSEEELQKGIRLACQVYVESDAVIEMLKVMGEIQQKLPETISSELMFSENIFQDSNKREVILQNISSGSYGIAVDIGTTTLAATMVSLKTGKLMAVTTGINHQREYGADVLTRIQAANEGHGENLRQSICADVRNLVVELLEQTKILRTEVAMMTIAANTTMCHLLLGLSCETLGVAPFTPVDISLQKRTYAQIFTSEELDCQVYILPGISAFIGADITAGIYNSGLLQKDKTTMLLDIGTNGEMVIGNKHGLLAASTAAGPVFEGGNISAGMPAVPGAISKIRIDRNHSPSPGEKAFISTYETILNLPAIGICGSAIIDIASELLQLGLIDENGTLEEAWFAGGFPITERISFTQKDIREVQMGKAAIRAGIETLIQEWGEMPEQICLAGGFGTYMDEMSAVRIGMFPQYFSGKIQNMGNTALAGAIQFMLQEETQALAAMQRVLEQVSEINLANHTGFSEKYMDAMFFEKIK